MWLIIIAVIVLVYLFFFRGSGNSSMIVKLIKKSAKWATIAQQDDAPIMAVLHANYAVGYLWALKDIAKPDAINKAAGINIIQFEEHILNVQDMVTKKVIKKCPEFEGDIDLYLSTIAD